MKKSSRGVWELELFWLLMGRVAEIMGGALLIPVADGLFWHETDIWVFLVPEPSAIWGGITCASSMSGRARFSWCSSGPCFASSA